MTEDQWWELFVQRVGAEAERRGGQAHSDMGFVQLEPPEGAGAVLRLYRYDDGFCHIETGFITKLTAEIVDFDDPSGLLGLVTALMDGHGEEGAGVDADGRWIEVSTVVDSGHGRMTSILRDPPDNTSSLRTFSRRIPAWGGAPSDPSIDEAELAAAEPVAGAGALRFLSLEEAVAEGITDEEGNFLEPPAP